MLAVAVVAAGFLRVVAFEAATVDAFAISASLFLIVTSSVVLGTVRRLAPRALAPSTQPHADHSQKRPSLSILDTPLALAGAAPRPQQAADRCGARVDEHSGDHGRARRPHHLHRCAARLRERRADLCINLTRVTHNTV
eukprot:scaffold81371_cov70-Phaeocystis_antarctica.AAC.4